MIYLIYSIYLLLQKDKNIKNSTKQYKIQKKLVRKH